LLSVYGRSAVFTSAVTGTWQTPGTWTVVGVDGDGVPDNNDTVVISTAGVTVTLGVASACRLFTISAGTLNMNFRSLTFYGNVTRTGGTITGSGQWLFYGNPATITGTFTNAGQWFFVTGSAVSIAATSVIQKNNGFTIYSGVTVTNNGIVRFTGGTISFNASSSTWVNAANSTLQVSSNFVGAGIVNASANPNTVVYNGSACSTIRGQTYHNLTIQNSGATSPSLAGAISVNGNLTIGATTTLNCNTQSIFLAGNWINNANITPTNQNQIIFVGSGVQTITRATGNTETFGSVIAAGTGTVLLNDSIFVNGSLDISSGTLDVNASNFSIRVRVNFNDNAIFNARQGTVFMVGTVAQTIGGVSTTTFYNLNFENTAGVTIPTFAKSISNILTVAVGACGTSGTGTLTLLATSPTTAARIAPLGATASLVGTGWIVQTYIDGPATAYWQYLTSPTTASTIADWDGDPRFYMSATGGNDGTACCPTFFSVKTYNEPTNTYSNVTTQGTALTPGRGFMVWMSDNLAGLTSPLIFDTRGLPNFNNVDRAVTAGGAGGGYNLVGNPYACPVTYSTVVAASTASLSGSFLILQENGSYATDPNGGTIAAGQGFLCIASTAGNISFTEAAKSTTATPNVLRLAGNEIRIKVGNEVNGLGEEAIVQLTPGGNESYDLAVDLPYIASPYDNATHIYTQNSFGEQFLQNNLGTEEDHLMIPVNVVTSTPGVQTITFKDLNTVTEYNCAWLEDLTTGARINLNQVDTYAFDESEMGATRSFILHFERTNDCSFDLQNSVVSLDAQTNVFVSGERIFAQFEFETEEIVTISMFDLSGRVVMGETTMNVSTQTITLENPDAHGIYLVRIQKGNEVSTKKIYY
jgi:hypothetical protein